MTTKEQYTPEEWRTLKDTPLLAGGLVMLASPQGPLGVLQEVGALSAALNEMLNHGASHELIDALRDDLRQAQPAGQESTGLAQLSGPAMHTLEQAQKLVLDHCREATQCLHLKAGEAEGAYYRHGVLWICWQVARSAREEGGLFGIHSVQVTDNEQQMIRKIAFALGISAQEVMQGGATAASLPAAPVRATPHALAERFSAEEWNVLRQAPVWVGAAVSAASPSGAWGTIQELNALARATQEVMQRFAGNRLIADLMDDMNLLTSQAQPVIEMPSKMSAATAGQRAVELCRQAVSILDQKASLQEASEYKQMLAHIAGQVAKGAREGGLLGLGAHAVSAPEQALLQQIAAALGLPL